jgi:hypothetical protein
MFLSCPPKTVKNIRLGSVEPNIELCQRITQYYGGDEYFLYYHLNLVNIGEKIKNKWRIK